MEIRVALWIGAWFWPSRSQWMRYRPGSRGRTDRPITKLRTTITNQESMVVPDGTALVYSEPL
jgi:hypothetical protein